jgi:hypothetical protein
MPAHDAAFVYRMPAYFALPSSFFAAFDAAAAVCCFRAMPFAISRH